MKRILSHIMMLVMLTGFFACTGELDNAGGNIGDKAGARLNFTGLNGFAVTRAVDQTTVANATVYLFEGKEAESPLMYTQPIVLAEPSGVSGLSGTFEVPEGGTFHIEVIANADPLTGVDTYEDFLGKTTTAAFDGNLVMQGSTADDVTLTAGTTTEIAIELVRLAATFAVTGAEEAGLTDMSFTLKNAVKASYFVKHVSDNSFTIPSGATEEDSAVPCSYENPGNTTSVAISGKMNGADYTAEVAVEKVLRNHLYTVKLVDNNGTIEPKLTVTDWADISAELEIGAGGELKMTASIDGTGIVATVVYPEEEGLKSTATVTVPASESKVYKIWVGSANIEAALTNTTLPDGWVLDLPANTRADYLWEKGYWTLTIPANTTAEAKSVTITATNKLVETAKVEMMFEQEGKEEEGIWNEGGVETVLSKFATADLKLRLQSGTTHENYIPTVSDIFDPTSGANVSTHPQYLKNNGYRYQWGRNFGFISTVVDDTNVTDLKMPSGYYYQLAWGPGTISQCNNNTYISDFIGIWNNVNTQLDYASDHQSDTKWINRGLQGKEPCPKGYRLPTEQEFNMLVPTVELVVGDVNFMNPNLVVIGAEIKNKGTDNAVAMQWAVTTRGWNYAETGVNYDLYQTHLVVTSVPVKSTATTVDKDDPIFKTASNRVMRNFVANGVFTNNGTSRNWGEFGGYWTADAIQQAQTSWAFEFGETISGEGPFSISMKKEHRVRALSIRCVKDE